jgi:hypothetical protein
MIANTMPPTSTLKTPKNVVFLRSADYELVHQAFVFREPSPILTWRGGVYEARTCTYSSCGVTTFGYVRVDSEDLSNVAIAQPSQRIALGVEG